MTNEDPDTARDVEKGDEIIAAAEESQLKRERDQLKQKVESLEKQIKLACVDWAEDDTAIRNLCRPFLTEKTCDHDGYAVIPVVDAVKNALESLRSQLTAHTQALKVKLEPTLSLLADLFEVSEPPLTDRIWEELKRLKTL